MTADGDIVQEQVTIWIAADGDNIALQQHLLSFTTAAGSDHEARRQDGLLCRLQCGVELARFTPVVNGGHIGRILYGHASTTMTAEVRVLDILKTTLGTSSTHESLRIPALVAALDLLDRGVVHGVRVAPSCQLIFYASDNGGVFNQSGAHVRCCVIDDVMLLHNVVIRLPFRISFMM